MAALALTTPQLARDRAPRRISPGSLARRLAERIEPTAPSHAGLAPRRARSELLSGCLAWLPAHSTRACSCRESLLQASRPGLFRWLHGLSWPPLPPSSSGVFRGLISNLAAPTHDRPPPG